MYWIRIIFSSVGMVFLNLIEINLTLRADTGSSVVEKTRIFCNIADVMPVSGQEDCVDKS
jgi:hypothetical protein